MKRKKANIIVSRTTLCSEKIKFCMQRKIFGKCLFAYKIRFAVEKKTKKKWGKNSKFFQCVAIKNFVTPSKFCFAIKKFQSYYFHIWKLYGKKFFQKKLNQFFVTSLKKPQKWFNFFSIVFRKCMKIA